MTAAHSTEQGLPNCDQSSDKEFDGVLYFESDHLALKNNVDYHKLLRTIAILEVQRVRAVEDLDRLHKMKDLAKEDPATFAKDVLNGDLNAIRCHQVEQLPKINWAKYNAVQPHCNETSEQQPMMTRNSAQQEAAERLLVRGRMFDQSKPETFNQLWTAEEQLRLEELLVEFPAEMVEFNRWRKIADALGNRTPKQVCSRVQKYFKKLREAGLRVPGRAPKNINKKTVNSYGKKFKSFYYRQSTFFPTLELAAMPESDTEEGRTNEELELRLEILARVKADKESEAGSQPFQHVGFKCLDCGEEPILGTRWRCLDCPEASFCSDCVVTQLDEETLAHRLQPLADVPCDPDYMPASFATHNYLDPNFMSG